MLNLENFHYSNNRCTRTSCVRLTHAVLAEDQVLEDVQRVVSDAAYRPEDPQELCGRLFTTCYMGSENSSEDTRNRAKELAAQIGRSDFCCFSGKTVGKI